MQLWVGNGCDAAVRVGHTVNTNNECLYQDFILHNEAHNQGLVGRHKLLQGLQAAICRNLNDFVVQSQQTEVALHSAQAHTKPHQISGQNQSDIWCMRPVVIGLSDVHRGISGAHCIQPPDIWYHAGGYLVTMQVWSDSHLPHNGRAQHPRNQHIEVLQDAGALLTSPFRHLHLRCTAKLPCPIVKILVRKASEAESSRCKHTNLCMLA